MLRKYRFFNELLDFIEIFLIPSVSVILPWKVTVFIFKGLSYIPFLYTECLDESVIYADKMGLLINKNNWIRAHKVIKMVDSADVFLCMTRGKGYIDKYVKNNFDDRILEQNIIFFPHYGAGMWIYKYFAINGKKSNLLMNDVPNVFSFRNLGGRFRLYVLAKYCNTKIIVPSNMLEIRKVLKNKETILVAPDAPKKDENSSFGIDTDIGVFSVNSSFFKLAESRKINVVNVSFDYNYHSGFRDYEADYLSTGTAFEYATKFAYKTVALIKAKSYLWTIIMVAPRIIGFK